MVSSGREGGLGVGSYAALPRVSIGSWAFAFGPYASHPWSFTQVCEFVAKAGYDGVEINGFRPHPHFDDFLGRTNVEVLKTEIAGFGLGVSAYAPDFHHVPPARVVKESYIAEIDKARTFCEQLGIGLLRVDTIMPPQEMTSSDYEQCFSQLVTTWGEAAERCRDSGVTLVWEVEPGFWLNRPSEVERLLTAVGDPNFGMLFDSAHAFTGGVQGARQGPEPELVDSVAAYATRLLPYIKHLHLADADGSLHDQHTSVHIPLGDGQVDFSELLRVLAPIADRLRWWCVDLCYCEDADAKASDALAYVRRLQQTIKHSGGEK